jgi:transcriptional regulator with XRE-family HTH domain
MSAVAARFGANLKRCRRRLALSQEDIALRASVHRTEIGLLENGRRVPRLDTVMKLATVLEVEVAELVEGIAWVSGEPRSGSFVIGTVGAEWRGGSV